MRDSFKSIINSRRAYNKKQKAASGAPEEHSEFEKLVDTCIQDIDARDEQKRAAEKK